MATKIESIDSRHKILDVAEALFSRRGFSGVGMRAVADAVGLGKSSLFHHFQTKAHLYLAVLQRAFERIEERLEAAFSTEGEGFERLEACIDALVDALAEQPTTARLLLRGLFEDDDLPDEVAARERVVEEILTGILARLRNLLQEGVDAGEFRSVSVPDTLQTLIGATVYHFASGEFGEDLLGQPLLSAEAVRRRKQELKDLLRHGLAPMPANQRPKPDPDQGEAA